MFYREKDECWRGHHKSPPILNLGPLAEIPCLPFCVHYILCRSHVKQNIAPWTVKQSCVFDRLILFLLLTSLNDGYRDAVRQARAIPSRRWAGRQKLSWEEQEGDLTAKKAPDTHVEAGARCLAPSREIGLKGSFPLGKVRPRSRQCRNPSAVLNSRTDFLFFIFLARVCSPVLVAVFLLRALIY